MGKKIRHGIIYFLTATKIISLTIGIFGFLFFACCADSPDEDAVFKGFAVCLELIVYAMVSEIVVVQFLLRGREAISPVFSFGFYNPKHIRDDDYYDYNKYSTHSRTQVREKKEIRRRNKMGA